LRQSKETTR